MNLYRWLISAFWLAFILYWAIAAIGVKRNVGGRSWRRAAALRLGVLVLVLIVLQIPLLRHVLRRAQAFESGSVAVSLIGVALCALGMALAMWARLHLGRNWGMPMSQKEQPEIIVTGPYALVRHPIYGGLLMAMLGTTMAASPFWLLLLISFGAYFLYSARREERLLCRQFPNQYPAYMKRTKMLLPFLL